MIHILNFNDEIIDFISRSDNAVIQANYERDKSSELLDLIVLSKRAEHFKKRNRVIIQDINGIYREFIIERTEENGQYLQVECTASYVPDISTAKPIMAGKYEKMTVDQKLSEVLRDTNWSVGDCDYGGIRTNSWTSPRTPYEMISQLTTNHKLEPDYEIIIEGNEVKQRLVNMKIPSHLFKRKEIVYGKDLLGIKRTVDYSEVKTALIGIGPEKENGDRIFVEEVDDEAQQQFNLPQRYIYGIYEPETEDDNMTLERLRTLTRTELNKRKSAAISYEISVVDLEKEYPHEIIRFGDIVRIKNPDFTPSLYAESEVIGFKHDLISGNCTYTFGNIVEYKEETLRKYFESKLDYIRQKLNDGLTNVNTIVTDVVEGKLEYFERKIIKGVEPPENPVNDMLWLDTSNPDVAVLRRYWEGQWINATAEKAEDIGAITREKALYSELTNTFVNLSIQHSKLLNEMHEVMNSEYLVNFDLKDELNAKLDATVSIYNNIKSNLESMTDETATIGKLIDTQTLFLNYRTSMQNLYNVVERAKIAIDERFKLLQSQFTDEKYNEAMEKVATAINGTWNAETGQLIADVPNEARLTELRQQIESTYDQELNSAMATLRNETDSKLVNTKNEISATVAKVDEKITGLTIGGRNLFINSGDLNTFVKLYGVTATRTLESTSMSRTGNLMHVSNIVRTQGNYVIYFPLKDMAPLFGTDNEVHTLSFYLKTNSPQAVSFVANGVSIVEQPNITVDNTAFKRVTVKFKAVTLRDTAINYNSHIVLTGSNLTDLWLYDLKLEKGNKATDWTPAPEDTTNKIATAQANAEAAAKAYADAQDALRKTEAQAYADGIVTAEEQRAINDAKAKLQEAKTYAEQQKQIAIDTANNNTTSALEPITVKTTNNEQSIKALEEQILLAATKEEVTQQLNTELQPIKTDVNDQKAQLSVMSDEISTKVSLNQYSLDQTSIIEELSRAETERTQLSNQISDRVTITEYNSGMQQKTNEINSAKAYADAQDVLCKTEAQAYADGIVDAEEQRAINDAQQKLAEAKADAQAKADTAESLAKQHANTQSTLAEQSAKAYADGLKQQTDQTLKTYDTRITQNGQQIELKASKDEFNKTRGTLDKTLAQIITSHSGISLTYDENGHTSDIIVDPKGISLNSNMININQGDVVIQNGRTTIKDAYIDKLFSNQAIINKLNSIDIQARTIKASDNQASVNVEGGTITMNRTDGAKLDIGIDGIAMYNSGGSKRFSMDRLLVESAALGTSNSNVYLAASDGFEARVVDRAMVPSDGSISSYKYLPIRSLALKFPQNSNGYVGVDGEFRIMSEGLVNGVYRDLRANGIFANRLIPNDATNLYLGTDSNVRLVAKGDDNVYRDLVANGVYADFVQINPNTSSSNLYLRASGEVRMTALGSTTAYQNVRANGFLGTFLDVAGNTNASNMYVRPAPGGALCVTQRNTTDTFLAVKASQGIWTSSEKYKENIDEWNENVLQKIKETKLYEYDLISEKNTPNQRRHHGVIIERQTPKEWVVEDGVDQYEMTTWSLKAIQELLVNIELMDKRIKKLEVLQNERTS